MWFLYDFGIRTVAVKLLLKLSMDSPRFPDPGLCLRPFLAVDAEKLMKSVSTWYSTGSSWADLTNGRKIRGWLYQFPGKLAVHPSIGVTQLTISKFPRNPPSSCAPRPPPAFEQLEYCWPWNNKYCDTVLVRPIDPILFGQPRLSAVERAHNNGCWPCANLVKITTPSGWASSIGEL